MRRAAAVVALALGASACEKAEETLRIGGRDLVVVGRHAVALEALQRGIDAHPTFAEASIVHVYYNAGYAGIDVELEPDRVVLREGPRYRVRRYAIIEDGQAMSSRALPPLAVEVGAWFSRDNLTTDVYAIQTRLRDAGHALATVIPHSTLDAARGQLDLRLDVTRGEICTFGSIVVSGHDVIDEAWIRTIVGVWPGERYNETALERAKAALEATGAFESVAIATATRDAAGTNPRVSVSIEVTEAGSAVVSPE